MKIEVKVKPYSKTEGVSQEGDSLTVKVKQPPNQGQANQAVMRLLAQHFGVPQSHVKILSGLRNKTKIMEVVER